MTQLTRLGWMMRFPPPVRFYAPLLVLVFGLATTWLGYELNLANDLARSLKDVGAQAEVTGDRLTKWAARQIEQGDPVLLAEDFRRKGAPTMAEGGGIGGWQGRCHR